MSFHCQWIEISLWMIEALEGFFPLQTTKYSTFRVTLKRETFFFSHEWAGNAARDAVKLHQRLSFIGKLRNFSSLGAKKWKIWFNKNVSLRHKEYASMNVSGTFWLMHISWPAGRPASAHWFNKHKTAKNFLDHDLVDIYVIATAYLVRCLLQI